MPSIKIVQATWVRYHHFDLARELEQMGFLERIFTCLPPWITRGEAVPSPKISCNFLIQGTRRVLGKLPFYSKAIDSPLACLETAVFSRWVAMALPPADAFFGISGTGLHAGRLIRKRGGVYICDRGSSHIRAQNDNLEQEYARWGLQFRRDADFLIRNEEAEYAESDLITVPARFAKATFVSQGVSADKIRVVPYGVNLEEFHPVGSPPEDSTFRLLFVGQVSLRKGIPYLLEAFSKFKHPKKELVIVGGLPPEITPILKQLSMEKIRMVGVVPRREVKDFMSTSHALVLPSIEEGLALVQAQALACGLPVIATPNTGSEDLFTHGVEGLVIPARNPTALVEAFESLAASPARRREMARNASLRAHEIGAWNTYATNIVAVIQESIERRKQ
jgi:glycosyltransferase involved in cell wall biosynthesis